MYTPEQPPAGSTPLDLHPLLPETLQRLDLLISERGLSRSEILDPKHLVAATALPEKTIRHLLKGGAPPAGSVNERVCARIKVLTDDYLARTGKRMSDLAHDLHERVGISEVWARQVCDGKKTPNIDLLHHLVKFFGVDGEEAFFTAPADQALNRVLLPILRQLESREKDPVEALLDRYGVKSTDLRMHGSMARGQLERLLEGVLKSVLPPEGDAKQ